ncbi:MAG: MAPEG family protein [Sphingomonadaceae bacterium]|nr:MAPEG family protein [Sphingomonadaceae bacterium]
MTLPVTAATAAALALLLLLLAIDTVRHRMRLRVAHGLADDARLTSASRAHANLAEHAPIVIILIGLLELSRAHHWALVALAGAFLLARLLHIHGLYNPKEGGPPLTRSLGVILTWLVLGALIVWTGWMLTANV